MKIENEITGILRVVEKETWNVVDLFSNDVKLGEFVFNPKHKSINVELSKCMGKILGINVTEYLDYMKLIEDLGLEIPKSYRRHWTPKTEQKHYYIDFEGDICPNGISSNFGYNEVDRRRCENFNMFPTRELAEKGKNLSKLGRLVLLWQYANDCVYEPDWKQDTEKWYISYDIFQHQFTYEVTSTMHTDLIYFETKTQLEKFGDMNGMEILRLLGVKS